VTSSNPIVAALERFSWVAVLLEIAGAAAFGVAGLAALRGRAGFR